MKKKNSALAELLTVTEKLRSPEGCPWDQKQDHMSIRFHAIEEVYELLDAIESRDDQEMIEELGDMLWQVAFHSQLGRERGAFDFEQVARQITDKLVRRHPHVFGDTKVKNVAEVWANWEKIKVAEKHGTRHARPSALDGIPKHLPALMRAEKLIKKACKAGLLPSLVETAEKQSESESPRRVPSRGNYSNLMSCKPRLMRWSAEESASHRGHGRRTKANGGGGKEIKVNKDGDA